MLTKLVIISLLTCCVFSCDDDDCVVGTSTRIAGGDIAERNSRPFQVALYLRVGTTGELGFCGGSLVHPQWVLTAAHCCFHDEEKVDHVQAIFGAHSLYDRYENGRRIVNVEEVVVHPDFDPEMFANDLALLRLANILQMTETINVVRLPYLSTVSHNFAGLGATASGWGIAAPGITFISPTLRDKIMTVMADPLCNSSFFDRLPENMLCGFSMTSGTCKGDNGGPLTIFFNSSEETILVGVTTFINNSGCNDNTPSVFTRVQRHLQWISAVTGIWFIVGGLFRKMQIALVVLSLVAAATAFSDVEVGYHRTVGIPLAMKIKAAEDAIMKRNANSRIVGGEEADPTSHPFLAGIIATLENTPLPSVCTATVVSPKNLVLAARCWDDGVEAVLRFIVTVGSNRLFSGGHRVETTNVITHPDWNPSTLENDIAFITLANALPFSDKIQPIALPTNYLDEDFVGETAIALGFGKTDDDQVGVSVLQVVNQVDLTVISTEACQAVYGTWAQDTNICTDGTDGVGICGGDIGGPLYVVRDETPVLVGVASFFASTGCQSGHPSAFTRVTSFYDFISENI
ncbi:transmembrane protease serine 9-like [Epargyreus clarus]|uniref:transmembrane protease serine 9-like n=1 Tax=Epargyreus clarus TaxID=520877 RepID=UPI003C2CA33F